MSEVSVSKYINLLIEFGEKLEYHVNKKYRSFIRATLNLKELAKNVNQQRVVLTHEAIAFKLGIESKSTKCIEMTLTYLLKLFTLGYIDIHVPNYCEDFHILEASIEKKPPAEGKEYERQLREEMCDWLSPLAHFKNQEINVLVLKIYEYLASEPILPSLLDLSQQVNSEQCHSVFFSYFSYRFYLFEEVYTYTKEQIQSFKHLGSNLTERHQLQIKNAHERQEELAGLVGRYLEEVVAKVAGEGGKHGCCVMCGQPADYYCKNTKAALCGLDCKQKHLEIASKQFKSHYQSILLGQSIQESMEILCTELADKDSPFLMGIFVNIIESPYLFMLVRNEFKLMLKKYLPKIMNRAYQSKHEQTFESLFFMMPSLIKWWAPESLSEVEYFFKENILRVLADKKANFRLLMLTFKSLDRIFDSGKTTVELYINLDCEMNRENVIGKTLFELSKMAQDRFINANFYMKQEKISIKNSCMTLLTTLSRGLNEYRRAYEHTTLSASKHHFLQQKERKTSMEKFVQKFNEHWSQGLKSLFNLDLVGLDSDQQIVNIIMSQGGLKKASIDMMLFEKTCQQYLEIFMSRLTEDSEESLIYKLLDLFQYIPLSENLTTGVKVFIEAFQSIYKSEVPLETQVLKILGFLVKCPSYKHFMAEIGEFHPNERQYDYLYLRMQKARRAETLGVKIPTYIICLSHSYLETLSSTLSLLQIPLSYLLETEYDVDRILVLTKQLIPISLHSNWVSLLIKSSCLDSCSQKPLTAFNIKLIRGILQIVTQTANVISENWRPILTFFCNAHFLLTHSFSSSKKHLQDNQAILKNQLTSSAVENALIASSVQCNARFETFMSNILACALETLKPSPNSQFSPQQEQQFMLQKFFHILQVNLIKYLKHFTPIFEQFQLFIQNISGVASPQIYIYICDNMKQLLLKIFKLVKDQRIEGAITSRYLTVYDNILKNSQSREIKEFIMNCITTLVVHHYYLKGESWGLVFAIVQDQTEAYPYQTAVIVRKILSEKMRGIEECEEVLIDICIKLAKSKDRVDKKASAQAIHNVKTILQLKSEQSKPVQSSSSEQEPSISEQIKQQQFFATLKKLLCASIEKLIDLLQFAEDDCETVAETLFLLFTFGTKPQPSIPCNQPAAILLKLNEEITSYVDKMFEFLEQASLKDDQQLAMADRIMNQTLYWSVRNHNRGIISNLEKAIIGKYSQLSLTALKCIKTYIQMADPREEAEWADIEETLMRIIENTLLQRDDQHTEQVTVSGILSNSYGSYLTGSVPEEFTAMFHTIHHCKLHNEAVKLLPNDEKCLPLLEQSYKEKIAFNDDILSRISMWRAGLCSNKPNPPDLLTLEEVVSNRIMAIYIRHNNYPQIIAFFTTICHKFIQASHHLDRLSDEERKVAAQSDTVHCQLHELSMDYWRRRKQPLLKLIGYVLPKLPRFCTDAATRKQLLLELSKMLPVVEVRDPFLKSMKELAQARY